MPEAASEGDATIADLPSTPLPNAFLPTEAEEQAAAKTASGGGPDTKANFWKSAFQTAPGT